MFKKICLTIALAASSNFAYAQTVNLNQLFEIKQNNFCYQYNSYKDIKNFFNIQEKSQLSLLGKPATMRVGETILEVNETESNIKKQLLSAQIKPFAIRDINKTKLDNLYTLEYTADIEIKSSPVETVRLFSKYFPGINFNPHNFGGSFIFKPVPQINYSKAKSMDELSQLIKNSTASSMAFSINKTSEGSLISYKCQVVAVTDLSPNSFAAIVSNQLNKE